MTTDRTPLRVAIGSDQDCPMFYSLSEWLEALKFQVTKFAVSCWPDVGKSVAREVVSGSADFGIVMCYSGTGVSIAANKVEGARAALCLNPESAKFAKMYNDANVIALAIRSTTIDVAKDIVESYLSSQIDPTEIANIKSLENH